MHLWCRTRVYGVHSSSDLYVGEARSDTWAEVNAVRKRVNVNEVYNISWKEASETRLRFPKPVYCELASWELARRRRVYRRACAFIASQKYLKLWIRTYALVIVLCKALE